MQTFIEKILNDERDYFLKEKEAEELKLTRGKQTPKERRDSDIWHCAALGILE